MVKLRHLAVRLAALTVVAGALGATSSATAPTSNAPWGVPALAEAAAALAHRRFGEAIEQALACLRAEDEAMAARCRFVLGRALFSSGRLEEAAAVLAAARPHLGRLSAQAAKLEGEALLVAGAAREAVAPLRATMAADPESAAAVRASALLADALLLSGDFAGAAAQATSSAALPGQPAEVKSGLALVRAEALAADAEGRCRVSWVPAASAVCGGIGGAQPPGASTGRAPDQTKGARKARRAASGLAARAFRDFWLEHPDHPAAGRAWIEASRLSAAAGEALAAPAGRELLQRASRLFASGQPALAAVQADEAAAALVGAEAAEAKLLTARALSADGRRSEAAPALQAAWKQGAPRVAGSAGLLFARDRARRGRATDAISLLDDLRRRYPSAPEVGEATLLAAHLELELGRKEQAQRRLLRLAEGHGAHASEARWTLAWIAYADGAEDAAARFARFAAAAESDEERAQGSYWQARAGPADSAAALFRRAAELDPLGFYGTLARNRLGACAAETPPFPPPAPEDRGALPGRLSLAQELFQLGFLAEAGAELDRHLQRSQGHPEEIARALPLYERARRYDRLVLLAQSLHAGRAVGHDNGSQDAQGRGLLAALYPAAYPDEVALSARRAGLDPYLLLSVARRESLFRADARSAAGAVGLLQLLPATARRAAVVLGRPKPLPEDLLDPKVAIDLGAWYLSELVGRFGDPTLAAAAYNAGPRVVAPWVARAEGQPLDRFIEEIPFRETRRYVKVIVGAWSAYRILAGGAPPRLAETVPPLKPGASF